MFGLLVAGRLCQTDFQRMSDTQFLINIPNADSVNHIVVFMTGDTPFPDTMGGAVYFSWPNPNGPCWKLLGHITNTKPSAIFKISKLKTGGDGVQNVFSMGTDAMASGHLAQIGISVEPLDQLAQQIPEANSAVSTVNAVSEYTMKMLENFYNFATSYSLTQSQMTPMPNETFVPMGVLQKWFESFKRKLQMDPEFWKK